MRDLGFPTYIARAEAHSLCDLRSPAGRCLMGSRIQNLKRSLNCFRTKSKVVAIESDDWGMDGMPSREVFAELTAEGCLDSADCFNKCGRETVADLDKLTEVLTGVRDETGRHAVLTANFVTANPDFREIEASGFCNYSWTAIDDVIRRPEQAALVAKYKEGMERGIICPQYHGRDHISAETWLRALRGGDPVAHACFRRRVPATGSSRFVESEYAETCYGTLQPLRPADIDAKVKDGIAIFERAFGFRPLTSIAPHYIWCDYVEKSLYEHGVRGIQAAGHRRFPSSAGGPLRPKVGMFGERSPAGPVYLSRNCWFRPSEVGEAAVEDCLRGIAAAFNFGYPAVIDTHRVNYVGCIDLATRNENLSLLRRLLREIISRFPGVRFAGTSEIARCLLSATWKYRRDPGAGVLLSRAPVVRRAVLAARERLYWWRSLR